MTKRGVVIIMNDEAYGSEYQQYKGPNYPEESIFIAGVDFAAIFRAFGGNAITVRNESDLDEFKKWVDSGKDGVYLLDCHISRSIAGPFIGKAFSTKE
ncbi:thiamine pyrophosphate-dependent enzyme [Corynebacterium renale]|uniref:thiamine pyrophosphate-dependent enzyme n=1 Tax=Corynebacterium renale TaxID=1724 RepID=UPI00069E21F9|nr:thiamine pyrophosphate-dependent enzyme [Corynebacterium renale]